MERKNWLDWLRVLGIYLVVLGHVLTDGSPVQIVLSNVRMPLFFFLSGLNRRPGVPWRARLAKDFHGILLPYFAFSILLYPYWRLVLVPRHPEAYTQDATGTLLKPLLGILLGVGYDTPWSSVISVPLWFLVALFLTRALADLLLRLPRNTAVPATLLLALGAVSVRRQGFDLLFSLDSALLALPFYIAGILLPERARPVHPRGRPWVHLAAAAALLAAMLPVALANGKVDLNQASVGQSPLLFVVAAALGILACLALGFALDPLRLPALRYLAASTLAIMALHSPFLGLGRWLLGNWTGSTDFASLSLAQSALLAAVAMGACLPLQWLLLRLAPWTLGRSRPGRSAKSLSVQALQADAS